jgi:hypothetical protein
MRKFRFPSWPWAARRATVACAVPKNVFTAKHGQASTKVDATRRRPPRPALASQR